jgi:hypothetical protein
LVTGDVPASPRSLVPDLPEDVDSICRRALAVDRDKRYGSALEMQKDLEASIARLPQRASERDIGEMIAGMFEQERQAMAAVIEKQLALLDATSTEEFALHSLPALNPAAGIMSLTPAKDSSSTNLGASARRWRVSSLSRRGRVVLIAVLGLLALIGVWGVSESGSPPPSASPGAKAATALPSAAVIAPAAMAPVATGAASDAAIAPAAPTRSSPAPVFAPPPRRPPGYAAPRAAAAGEMPTELPPPATASPRAVTTPTYGPLDDRR